MAIKTQDELMEQVGLNSDEEFEYAYNRVLELIRDYCTYGIDSMVKYVEQELAEGNESP